ncbi:MAG: response regulator [Bdellovibrionaceae bacterium]|nr:response regulator [Pseudobdellovibrionaceae bacterium]
MKRTLILDDDLALAQSFAREFEDAGHAVVLADSLAKIPAQAFDYAVLDVRLKGELGMTAIDQIKAHAPHCRIVMLSGYGSIATAVEAVKKGAADYLTKPASFAEIWAALEGRRRQAGADLKTQSLSEVEHEHIEFVLSRNRGNISQTAKELGLHRQSLQRKLKKYT